MQRISTAFLQAVVVLTGIVAVTLLIWFPLTEGRATNLDLFSVYFDPFILYGYAASIAFFVALYQVFKLLRYIRENHFFSQNSVKALKSIKYSAVILSITIVLAGVYILLFHDKNDDPAGFLALCVLTSFISVIVATTAAIFEKLLQKALNTNFTNV